MQALHLNAPVTGTSAVESDDSRPKPGPGELLISVRAAGLTATETSWYPTTHTKSGGARVGAVPGHEFSGVVSAIGDGVGSLEIGRAVYGMNDWYANGAMAEYCIAPFFAVAPKPACLTDTEAASVPIGALTAWQALFDHAQLQPGERVLIHGGAGAIGTFAIQLAKLHGAYVVATASSRNCDFVRGLGADEVIDYHASRFEDVARDIDVVLDTVGGDTLERSWTVLRPSGRLVTVVSAEANSADPRVRKGFFIVEPIQKQLFLIAELLDTGKLRAVVDSVIPLSQAPEAYAGKLPREGRGKVVISIPAAN